MKLEQQLVSLELSKKLKELGVKQESLYYHVDFQGYDPEIIRAEERQPRGRFDSRPNGVSAYTVAELGEMIPGWIGHPIALPDRLGAGNAFWWIVKGHGGGDRNEANARAKMLIYLKENKLISNLS